MITFLACLTILLVGSFFYGKYVEKTFAPDSRVTPAIEKNDGVDFVQMPIWKLFLIQLLNIAGLGPIFGALQGALWGPVVYLWIIFGAIFAGGVHDFFSGMISERNEGKSVSETCGSYLGKNVKYIMRTFCIVLLIMIGVVFTSGPAGLLVMLFKGIGAGSILTNLLFWITIIFAYYVIATFVSIDKIIGKFYPIFGVCLILMAIGVIAGVFINYHVDMPELWNNFKNLHPEKTPIFPYMFITVACGAISGFHSTQSPIVARCIKSEKEGRMIFYGAMIAESVIALVWAAAGVTIYEKNNGLNTGLMEVLNNGQAAAIYDVCLKTMGSIGIILAVVGVVICPITSGDTAFRSARLMLADWCHIDQKKITDRLKIALPILLIGAVLVYGNAFKLLNYTIIWRYFSWTNQTLAMIFLWAVTMYLVKNKKNYFISLIPAVFMTAVSTTYFVSAKECLHLGNRIAVPAGIIVSLAFILLFILKISKKKKG